MQIIREIFISKYLHSKREFQFRWCSFFCLFLVKLSFQWDFHQSHEPYHMRQFFFCSEHHFNSSRYYYYNSMLKCQTNHTTSRKSEIPQNCMNKTASLSFIDLNFRCSIKGEPSVIIIQLKCHWNQFFFISLLSFFSFIFYLFQPKKKTFSVEKVTTSKANSVKSARKRLMIPIY